MKIGKILGLVAIILGLILILGINYYDLLVSALRGNQIKVEVLKKELQEGDVVFQNVKTTSGKILQLATKAKYNNIGVVYKKNGDFYVLEVTKTVGLIPLKNWIKQGEKSRYAIKRLEDSTVITPQVKLKMEQIGEEFSGRNCDLFFEWSDVQLYCSEMVWKIYKESANIELGDLQELKDFNLAAKKVAQKLYERYGSKVPMEETVISPESIYQSVKLKTIHEE